MRASIGRSRVERQGSQFGSPAPSANTHPSALTFAPPSFCMPPRSNHSQSHDPMPTAPDTATDPCSDDFGGVVTWSKGKVGGVHVVEGLDFTKIPKKDDESPVIDVSKFTTLDLSVFKNLETLNVSRLENLASLDVTGVTTLKVLNVSGTKLTGITELSGNGFAQLSDLDISSTKITNVAFLNSLTELRNLKIAELGLTDLNLDKLSYLKTLDIDGNKLTFGSLRLHEDLRESGTLKVGVKISGTQKLEGIGAVQVNGKGTINLAAYNIPIGEQKTEYTVHGVSSSFYEKSEGGIITFNEDYVFEKVTVVMSHKAFGGMKIAATVPLPPVNAPMNVWGAQTENDKGQTTVTVSWSIPPNVQDISGYTVTLQEVDADGKAIGNPITRDNGQWKGFVGQFVC